jgi:transposase-like protein
MIKMSRTFGKHSREEECIQGLVGKSEAKRPLVRYRCRRDDNIKMYLREIEWRHGLDSSGSG